MPAPVIGVILVTAAQPVTWPFWLIATGLFIWWFDVSGDRDIGAINEIQREIPCFRDIGAIDRNQDVYKEIQDTQNYNKEASIFRQKKTKNRPEVFILEEGDDVKIVKNITIVETYVAHPAGYGTALQVELDKSPPVSCLVTDTHALEITLFQWIKWMLSEKPDQNNEDSIEPIFDESLNSRQIEDQFEILNPILAQQSADGNFNALIDGWRVPFTETALQLRWNYTGAPIAQRFRCQLQRNGEAPEIIDSFSIMDKSGLGICDFNIGVAGTYALRILVDNQQVWEQVIEAGPNSDAEGETASGDGTSEMASGWATRLTDAGESTENAGPSESDPLQGRWQGEGSDEGFQWGVIFDVEPNAEIGAIVGRSEYRMHGLSATDRVCHAQLILKAKEENHIIVTEIPQRNLNRNCIENAPYGKDVQLEIRNKFLHATWRKKNNNTRITMETYLERYN